MADYNTLGARGPEGLGALGVSQDAIVGKGEAPGVARAPVCLNICRTVYNRHPKNKADCLLPKGVTLGGGRLSAGKSVADFYY